VESGGQTDRAHPLAGRLRQSLLCWAKRDFLFMAATQSIYMLRLNIQGAAPG